MFEALLARILQKFLGQFFNGLDEKNLNVGVWSGNVEIKSISLKPEAIQMLELPIKLVFSHIGRIQMKIPWKSLSSSPCEIVLEDILISVSLLQKQEEWIFKDYNTIKRKFDEIEKYVEEAIKKLVESELKEKKEKEKDPGMATKMAMKIVDNLQVTINNIHFRIEAEGKQSFGISLERFDAFTTDAKGSRVFIDRQLVLNKKIRTKEANKEQPMLKSLKLSNFAVQWNPEEKDFTGKQKKSEMIPFLLALIKTGRPTPLKVEQLISISVEGKLTQNSKNSEKPEYEISVNFSWIDVNIAKNQISQVLQLAESFTTYQKILAEKRKICKKISESLVSEYRKEQIDLFTKIKKGETIEKGFEQLSKEEKERFETILTSIPSEGLLFWTKEILIQIQKDEKILKLMKEKQKKSGGFFSKKKAEEVTEEESAKIDEFINQQFSGEILKNIIKPPE